VALASIIETVEADNEVGETVVGDGAGGEDGAENMWGMGERCRLSSLLVSRKSSALHQRF
jgi:hypothetical protein